MAETVGAAFMEAVEIVKRVAGAATAEIVAVVVAVGFCPCHVAGLVVDVKKVKLKEKFYTQNFV